MKKIIPLTIFLTAALTMAACGRQQESVSVDPGKLQVSVSFNALYEFASAVGGDKVQISTIIPDGTEPHDFEPKSGEMKALSHADVFIYNGLDMEHWADDLIKAASNKDMISVEASKGVDAIPLSEESQEEDAEADDHEHGEYDPHVWLSITGAKMEIQNIADAFSKADSDNKDFYQKNAAAYVAKLDALFTEYQGKFKTLTNKNFVTSHAAFNYFCRDFGLTQSSVENIFAEGEPSPKQLTTLVDYCKEHHVKTIFAEELGNTDISKTLATEVGGKVETIYTMESGEDNMTYLERMESNCKKVYESLSE